ncbi:MAG: hypothetical protein ACRD0W_03745 [Acidimicrobiales bacterium]
MPDLLAGTTVNALDSPVTVADSEPGSFTFTNTTYGIGTTGGTYVDCGVAFVAPTTGRVLLHYSCNIANSSTASTLMAPVVREGGTVGSGTTFLVALDDNAVTILPTAGVAAALIYGGRPLLVTGLTPGSTYNVRLEHRVSAGSPGTLARRAVTVSPAT